LTPQHHSRPILLSFSSHFSLIPPHLTHLHTSEISPKFTLYRGTQVPLKPLLPSLYSYNRGTQVPLKPLLPSLYSYNRGTQVPLKPLLPSLYSYNRGTQVPLKPLLPSLYSYNRGTQVPLKPLLYKQGVRGDMLSPEFPLHGHFRKKTFIIYRISHLTFFFFSFFALFSIFFIPVFTN
jgi:hypothetical protein